MSTHVERRVVLVLGMHRSGTSALAGALHALGLGLPENLLPPAPDNPGGYFESKDLTLLNEEILVAAGTAWHDPAPIPDEWFATPAARAFRGRAQAFVNKALSTAPIIVLKDPRLCRLLPFWLSCLTDLEVSCGSVVILRDPQEVARSLQVRVLTELTRPGGPLSIARTHWLWLRYVLEAEKGSRDLPRALLTYEALLNDGPRELASIGKLLDLTYPIQIKAVEGRFDRELKRQEGEETNSLGWPSVATDFYFDLAAQISQKGEVDRKSVDRFRETFETVALPNEKPIHSYSTDYGFALIELGRARWTLQADGRLLFISDNPETRGHLYRVEHHVAALRDGGLRADWCLLEDFSDDKLAGVSAVIVFRIPWDARMAALYAACRERGI
ncbi:MAG TPA: hypothetical protein VGL24_03290, partial [Chthoniobacterales bacterium]